MSCSETNGNFVWVSRNANPVPHTQGMGIISGVMLSCDAFVSSTSLYSGMLSIQLGQVVVLARRVTLRSGFLSRSRDSGSGGDGSVLGGLGSLLGNGLGLGLGLGLRLLSGLGLLGGLGLLTLSSLLGNGLGLGGLLRRLSLALR